MSEKQFVLTESLLNDILYLISNSRSELKVVQVVNVVDKLRNLKTVEEVENAKKKDTEG